MEIYKISPTKCFLFEVNWICQILWLIDVREAKKMMSVCKNCSPFANTLHTGT